MFLGLGFSLSAHGQSGAFEKDGSSVPFFCGGNAVSSPLGPRLNHTKLKAI